MLRLLLTQRLVIISFLTLVITSGCSHEKSELSQTKIINGVKVKDTDWPQVAFLTLVSSENLGTCSGTFVNPRQLITAAHCFKGINGKGGDVFYVIRDPQNSKPVAHVKAVDYVIHPKKEADDGARQFDVAIVNFKDNVTQAFALIGVKRAAIKDPVTVVGFGRTDPNKPNTGDEGMPDLHMGRNTITLFNNDMIGFVRVDPQFVSGVKPGEMAVSSMGDSGGPVFRGDELIGVISGGKSITTGNGTKLEVSLSVDLTLPSVKEFLDKHLDQNLNTP